MRVFDDVFQLTDIVGQPTLVVQPTYLRAIDTGVTSDTDHILGLIESLGRAPSDLKHIVITHADDDHIGGRSRLTDETEALVYASTLEADVVEGEAPSREGQIAGNHAVVDRRVGHGERLIEDGIRVVGSPGHTAGCGSNNLSAHHGPIAGDCLNNVAGLAASMEQYTADQQQADRTVQNLATLEPSAILFGHGLPITTDAAVSLRALARRAHPSVRAEQAEPSGAPRKDARR